MRFLITTSPGLGHVFPVISTAHALRAAGHEVLLATAGGEQAANAGLTVVDSARGEDVTQIFMKFAEEQQAARSDQPKSGQWGITDPEVAARLFSRVSDATADGVIAAARAWQPDLVLHTPLQGDGPLVAAALDVPLVEHGITLSPGAFGDVLASQMTDTYQRHGVDAPRPRAARIVVAPPSMGPGGEDGILQRYVPYNGGGVLPEWLLAPSDRPRIAVTLGTVVSRFAGLGLLGGVVAAAREIDAEFIIASGDADPAALGDLPENVRVAGWVPLGALLDTCQAVVHHGGSGSTLTSLVAGVTQLVLPSMADQPINAELVANRGVGLAGTHDEVTPAVLRRLLEDEDLRGAAHEVRDEIAGLPSPADLVPTLVKLAS